MKNKFVSVIIPSAGSGRRMFSEEKKQFIHIKGKALIIRTLEKFQDHPGVNEIIVVTAQEDIPKMEALINSHQLTKVATVVAGGRERQDSISNGLAHVSKASEIVMVHDGARPFVSQSNISESIKYASTNQAVILAVPVKDTIKVCLNQRVEKTLDRDSLWQVQTPQTFDRYLLEKAYDYGKKTGFKGTDDASLVEHLGEQVVTIMGSYDNIKITTRDDLHVGEQMIKKQETKTMRIGMGYDVHRLVENRPLILGGVTIDHNLGLLGHSDADVLVHAVMDAIIGALGLGDIGKHFPDTDPQYKGVSSMVLLDHVMTLVGNGGYKVNNLDCTVIAQKPKLLGDIPQMSENLANGLKVGTKDVNVKATTTEKLGFVGREEGIAAEAVVILVEA